METNLVQKHWDKYGAKPAKQWLHNVFVRKKILLEPLGWYKGLDWFNWLQRTYFEQPVPSALSICCGSGQHERRLAQLNVAEKIEGFDISEGQLERARQLAAEKGYHQIEYQQHDIQKCPLKTNKYDLILAVAGLHHLDNLSYVFEQFSKALKPDGILVLSEYVGPNHMDHPQFERELIQKTLDVLPTELKVKGSNGAILERAGHQTKEQAIARDPSEGIKSAEIMENLYKYFYSEVEIEMGHSLLRECLYDIADNFEENPAHEKILLDLINLDRSLRNYGLLQNHHVFGVYRPSRYL
jgi:2-polyprenyl-3-methyl-5-hydroxy-6-metoxy-1,4-benzoquinol methylase